MHPRRSVSLPPLQAVSLEITPDRILRMRLPLRIVVPADTRDRFEPVLGSEHLSTSLEDAFGCVRRSLEQR